MLVLLLLISQQCYAAITSSIHGGCRMAYMSPHYERVEGVSSRLNGKYSLELYREAGWDLDPSQGLKGFPVLFLPGNAGSGNQIRSIASSAARQFYASPGVPDAELLSNGIHNLDFFALDFNEDFSAFHGQTIRDQAEYASDVIKFLLRLYDKSPFALKSIAVIAHSMGGISARSILARQDYVPGSIHTLITLSTPHASPPAPFDRAIDQVYAEMDAVWSLQRHTVQDLLLVSVAGGTADTMIASDTTSLAGLNASENVLPIFTTGIPGLFSAVDHRAMMWCDQLRTKLATALLYSYNSSLESSVKSLSDRRLLFEQQLTIPRSVKYVSAQQHSLVATSATPKAGVTRIDYDSAAGRALHLLLEDSTAKLQSCKGEECGAAVYTSVQMPASRADRTTNNTDNLRILHVVEMQPDHTHLEIAADFDFHTPISAYYGPLGVPLQTLDWSPTGVALFEHKIDLPEQLMTTYRFPQLKSHNLAYTLRLKQSACLSKTAPMVHVYSQSGEDHWLPKMEGATIYLYSAAHPDLNLQGMYLDIIRDPQCSTASLSIRLALLESLKVSLLANRLFAIAWPFGVTCLLLQELFKKDITLCAALLQLVTRRLALWAIILTLLALLNYTIDNDQSPVELHWPLVIVFLFLSILAVFLLALVTTTLAAIYRKVSSSLSTTSNQSAVSRSWLIAVILVLLVTFYAPVHFLLMGITILAAFQPSFGPQDRANSILLLALLPATAPVLLVWMRNLSVGWYAPFSSDRNPLQIIGFVLWYQLAARSPVIDTTVNNKFVHSVDAFLRVYLVIMAVMAFTVGMRHTWLLLPFTNVWLILQTLAAGLRRPRSADAS